MEIWKDIIGFENCYQVSNYGRVKSLDRKVKVGNYFLNKKGKILKPYPNSTGYLWIDLFNPPKRCRRQVHRLVMEIFIGKSKLIVNHKDLNPKNNKLNNLEYTTYLGNSQHAWANHVFPSRKGENNSRSKLTDKQRNEICLLKGKLSAKQIAKKYSMSTVHIHRILRTWINI